MLGGKNREKNGEKRTGDDLVQETRETKRSSNMKMSIRKKEWDEKMQQISFKPLFFT